MRAEMQEVGCAQTCAVQAARRNAGDRLHAGMQEAGCAQTCEGLTARRNAGGRLRAHVPGQAARRNAGSRLRANVSGGRLRAEMQEVGCAEACEVSGCTQKFMR